MIISSTINLFENNISIDKKLKWTNAAIQVTQRLIQKTSGMFFHKVIRIFNFYCLFEGLSTSIQSDLFVSFHWKVDSVGKVHRSSHVSFSHIQCQAKTSRQANRRSLTCTNAKNSRINYRHVQNICKARKSQEMFYDFYPFH